MSRPLLLLGWAWPFVVAAGGVAYIAAGGSVHSGGSILLSVLALAGSPAVFVSLAGRLPKSWWPEPRYMAATLLTAPVVGVELLLAVWLFAYGANAAGPGWIE